MNSEVLRIWRYDPSGASDEVGDVREFPARTRYRTVLRDANVPGQAGTDLIVYRKTDGAELGRFSLENHQFAVPGQSLPVELQERLERAAVTPAVAGGE